MGMLSVVPAEDAKPASRRDEAYHFIRDYIMRTGNSPSMENVRIALGVGRTRAKALVHQLAVAKMIERDPGSQRGISIPGLARERILQELRAEGFIVDRDVINGGQCPQGHLPLIAILEHVPTIVAGDHHDQSEHGGSASL